MLIFHGVLSLFGLRCEREVVEVWRGGEDVLAKLGAVECADVAQGALQAAVTEQLLAEAQVFGGVVHAFANGTAKIVRSETRVDAGEFADTYPFASDHVVGDGALGDAFEERRGWFVGVLSEEFGDFGSEREIAVAFLFAGEVESAGVMLNVAGADAACFDIAEAE